MKIKYLVICIVVLIGVGLLMATHGWRLFGFSFCKNPDHIAVQNIDYNEEIVKLTGTTSTSGDYFAGYTYKIEDDNLYIGLKYNLIIFSEKDGDFNIELDMNEKNIKKIYLKGEDKIREIWSE